MSAYRARGGGAFTRLRVQYRLSLEELALILLVVCDGEDIEADADLAIAEVRRLVAGQLATGGKETLLSAADLREEKPELLAWCRRQVARAYARDYARFPEELARFRKDDT